MDYQLVFQFPSSSIADYDLMVSLENELLEELGSSLNIDGHDCGNGKANIFIITSDPFNSYQLTTPILKRKNILDSVTVAYRPMDGKHYTIIWPPDSTSEFKID